MKLKLLFCLSVVFVVSLFAARVPMSDIARRANNKPLPSLYQPWGALVDSAATLDEYQRAAKHGLVHQTPEYFKLAWVSTDGFPGTARSFSQASIDSGLQLRARLLKLNPNIILIGEIRNYDAQLPYLPSNSSYWMRNTDGTIKINSNVGGGYYLLNPSDTAFQNHVGLQAKALLETGVVDGIFLDWATDDRVALFTRVRQIIGDNAVILGNVNYTIQPKITKLINAVFMECGFWGNTTNFWTDVAKTISYSYDSLRQPRLICTEIWPDPSVSGTPLYKFSQMRAGTTVVLTHSEGYFLYYPDGDNLNGLTLFDHMHTIYPFWKCDIGRPLSQKTLFNGAWVREYQNATVVYNPKGNTSVTMTFTKPVKSQASGKWITSSAVAGYDGDIFIKDTTFITSVSQAPLLQTVKTSAQAPCRLRLSPGMNRITVENRQAGKSEVTLQGRQLPAKKAPATRP